MTVYTVAGIAGAMVIIGVLLRAMLSPDRASMELVLGRVRHIEEDRIRAQGGSSL